MGQPDSPGQRPNQSPQLEKNLPARAGAVVLQNLRRRSVVNWAPAGRTDYDARIMKRLAWRLFDLFTLGFAALGFFYVPLCGRTGYEHAHAFATNPRVQEFAAGVVDAARQLRSEAGSRLREVISPPADPANPS